MVIRDNLTGEVFKVKDEEPVDIEIAITRQPTPEQRIADVEAEIARLKSELNVQ